MTAQERLDLPDFLALQGMVDDAMQLQIGALIGRGGGVFSPFTAAMSTDGVNRWMTLTPFQYYWSSRETDLASGAAFRGQRGGVSQFNPNAPGQTIKILYNDALALGTATTLYARPQEMNTDTDARRKFAAGVEQSTSMQTRTTIVTQFKFSALAPDHSSNNGWAPVLYIGGWAANLPIDMVNISVWDSWSAYAVSGQTNNYATDNATGMSKPLTCLAFDTTDAALPAFNGAKSADDDLGLLQLLMMMRMQRRRMLDTAGSLNWYADPPKDLQQLNADLDVVIALALELNAYRQESPIPWAAGYIYYDGGGGVMVLPPDANINRGKPKNCTLNAATGIAGDVYIDVTNVPSGYRVVSVSAMRADLGGAGIITAYITQNVVPGTAPLVHFQTWGHDGVLYTMDFYFTVFISKDV